MNDHNQCKAHPGSTNSQTGRRNGRRRTECVPRRARHGGRFLQCRVVKASDMAVAIMYSIAKDSITIPIHAYMWHKTAKVLALLDSGAMENVINKRTVTTLRLGTQTLVQPLSIHNVDRTMNREGQITQYCDLWIRQGKQNTKLRFYVTSLGRD